MSGTAPPAGVATPPAPAGTAPAPPRGPRLRRVALAGNPNVGKSSLFNALTGLHQKVTNYPGVTVERKTGRADVGPFTVEVVDLPGTYSLSPHSLEEAIVRDELLGRLDPAGRPDLVVLVLDATNLARNLYFALQVLESGTRAVAALNCVDAAEREGSRVDARALSRLLGIPVVPTVGRTGEGIDRLREAIAGGGSVGTPPVPRWRPDVDAAAAVLAGPLAVPFGGREEARRRLPDVLGSEGLTRELLASLPPDLAERVERERSRIPARGGDAATASATARYEVVDNIVAEVLHAPPASLGWRERLDRAFTHRAWGTAIFVAVFLTLFLAVFSWSGPLMDAVEGGCGLLGAALASVLPAGLLRDFLVDGVVAGFSAVLVFVPQIAVMFLIVEFLEDSGYLARAAFLLDRILGRAGLPGRAFLPLMSSHACAIPGIMAARTIRDPRDRMATIFIAPFMSCSARLPIYLMVVGALFSGMTVLGILPVAVVVMIAMYLLGIGAGLFTAGLLRRTILKGGRSPLLLELPAYRWPSPRALLLSSGRRTWTFVSKAGPVILVLSMVLWALMTFPRDVPLDRDYGAMRAGAAVAAEGMEEGKRTAWLAEETARIDGLERGERSAKSYAGRLGRWMEPAIRPLGFDWKIGIGLVGSFAAREVFVSTLGVVYATGTDAEDDAGGAGLREAIRSDVDPVTGRPVFRPLVGISLLVFFVLAMQCMSTLAVVRRETGGWKWPLAMLGWMTGLAWLASFTVFQVGSAFGY